jgi:serine protease Do
MDGSRIKGAVLAVAAVSLLTLGYRFGVGHANDAGPPAAASATGAAVAPGPTAAPGAPGAPTGTRMALPDFSSIVAQYGPAVVNVRVAGMLATGERAEHGEDDMPGMNPGGPGMNPGGRPDAQDPFGELFRHFQQMPHPPVPMHGMGSGFIVSPDGIILTNAHVVAGSSEVTVKLVDRREFKAKVLGLDKATDVAVLKIDAHELPVVKIGDAGRERVGEWAVAIGAPFGFENTATAGIISAKARSLPDQGYVQFIQTDVPVNPGNSGGPLFNLDGEVIGINSQIYSGTGGYQGVSFAIPINLAMQIEQQLVKNGKVERAQLGISIQSVDQSLAQAFGLKQAAGALISSVSPGSAGARAGLAPGEIILQFNGQPIADAADLPPLVASVKPGESATLTLWHQGRTREVSVTLGDAAAKATLTSAAQENDSGKARLGLAVRPLTPEERTQAQVSGGLMVDQVAGPAAKAGIEPGDIVLAVNGEPIASVSQLRTLVGKAGQHLALLVQHQDARIFVPIDLG